MNQSFSEKQVHFKVKMYFSQTKKVTEWNISSVYFVEFTEATWKTAADK